MTDSLTPEMRSINMSHIHGNNTSIEIKVRQYLFKNGFRYRKNVKNLPGKPDIVLSKYKTVIFIHGCFWHRHENCKRATMPKSNTEYWSNKFEKNVENDKTHIECLHSQGWHVIVLWECEINRNFDVTMQRTIAEIKQNVQMNNKCQKNC